MKSILKRFLVLLFMAALFPTGKTEAKSYEIKRISGDNRYETAVEISKASFKSSQTAVLAFGGNYPNALVGGTLATQIKAPLLLTGSEELPSVVKEELKRLNVEKIYILGGTGVVSERLEESIRKDYTVYRLGGRNRYFTARDINFERQRLANVVQEIGDWRMYSVVSNNNFPDALTASPLVGQLPIHREAIHTMNMTGGFLMMPRWKNTIDYGFYTMGGFNAVPYDPVEDVGAFFGERIMGSNRYATAAAVAELYPKRLQKKIDTVVLADGLNYPDALSSAPFVGQQNAVLLLTDPNKLPKETKEYIKNHNIQKIEILGGEKAVADQIVEEINGITK
ncbi:cell wall-binding repeat-containing protein [Gallicola sp. Sow4_E12]|uniref:cell wall-binding repeat-containing protein n=1 Tax=Gallicola sp. Sow4_E12 TaxID=3438785 RepID=UPI003F8E3233